MPMIRFLTTLAISALAFLPAATAGPLPDICPPPEGGECIETTPTIGGDPQVCVDDVPPNPYFSGGCFPLTDHCYWVEVTIPRVGNPSVTVCIPPL